MPKLRESALVQARHELKLDNIQVVKKLDNKLPVVTGDIANISKVFIILVTNAVDAMQKGGVLTISTKICNKKDILPGKSDFIETIFQDTGCGISSENIRKIFEPFFTTKETGDGTGLGLALSYGIIRDHGGIINVKSEVDKGTEFALYLPIKK